MNPNPLQPGSRSHFFPRELATDNFRKLLEKTFPWIKGTEDFKIVSDLDSSEILEVSADILGAVWSDGTLKPRLFPGMICLNFQDYSSPVLFLEKHSGIEKDSMIKLPDRPTQTDLHGAVSVLTEMLITKVKDFRFFPAYRSNREITFYDKVVKRRFTIIPGHLFVGSPTGRGFKPFSHHHWNHLQTTDEKIWDWAGLEPSTDPTLPQPAWTLKEAMEGKLP